MNLEFTTSRLPSNSFFSDSDFVSQLVALAALHDQARPHPQPQDADDEEEPQGDPRLLRLQVSVGEGAGHGGHQ